MTTRVTDRKLTRRYLELNACPRLDDFFLSPEPAATPFDYRTGTTYVQRWSCTISEKYSSFYHHAGAVYTRRTLGCFGHILGDRARENRTVPECPRVSSDRYSSVRRRLSAISPPSLLGGLSDRVIIITAAPATVMRRRAYVQTRTGIRINDLITSRG